MRIDAHQHFWLYEPVKDAWIGPTMEVIRKNFLPNDVSMQLKQLGLDGAVAVQADQSHRETDFLLELATVYALIKGVVGWVDLRSDRIEEYVQRWSGSPVLKGFRHLVEQESDPDFLIKDEFYRGLQAIQTAGYTFDLLVSPPHYAATLRCVAANPQMNFVLDHMGKPRISKKGDAIWADFIEKLASYPQVCCKVSGMVTEADWANWRTEDFLSYVKHVVECFGPHRIMFGSDWPVCLLASDYPGVVKLAEKLLADLAVTESSAFWGENAANFYQLK